MYEAKAERGLRLIFNDRSAILGLFDENTKSVFASVPLLLWCWVLKVDTRKN